MGPVELAILFAVLGFLLIVADLFIPSGGVLSGAGALAMMASIVCCFMVSTRLGALAAVVVLVLSPFAVLLFLRVWPNTFVGKRMTLTAVATTGTAPAPLPQRTLRPGDRGVAMSELRPAGVCEFDGERVEAISDRGLIEPGTAVVVVSIEDHRPVVRPVASDETEPA